MTLEISLPPDTEAELRRRAAAVGKDVAAFVQEALQEKLAAPARAETLTAEQRAAAARG